MNYDCEICDIGNLTLTEAFDAVAGTCIRTCNTCIECNKKLTMCRKCYDQWFDSVKEDQHFAYILHDYVARFHYSKSHYQIELI